jgi:hypothetical protein
MFRPSGLHFWALNAGLSRGFTRELYSGAK